MQFGFHIHQARGFRRIKLFDRNSGHTGNDRTDVFDAYRILFGIRFALFAQQVEFNAEFVHLIADFRGTFVILFLHHKLFFARKRLDAFFDFGKFGRTRIVLYFFHCAAFVQKVYGFVGQKAVGNIAFRKTHYRFDNVVGIGYAVKLFVAAFYAG